MLGSASAKYLACLVRRLPIERIDGSQMDQNGRRSALASVVSSVMKCRYRRPCTDLRRRQIDDCVPLALVNIPWEEEGDGNNEWLPRIHV